MNRCVFTLTKIYILNNIRLFIIICIFGVFLYEVAIYSERNFNKTLISVNKKLNSKHNLETHTDIIKNFYDKRKSWKTSNLGSILFKNFEYNVFRRLDRENRTYVILIWKHWHWLKNRHINGFNSSQSSLSKDPLSNCSVTNCIFTGNDSELTTADAVVVHLQKGLLPNVKTRNHQQRWVFLTDESPRNLFSLAKKKRTLSDIANIFNWSMTYRSDSDVPVPYGRTVPLNKSSLRHVVIFDLVPNWKKKRRNVLVAVLISNCDVNFRMQFINNLEQYLKVDIYGQCSNNYDFSNRCPGHFRSDCKVISEYLFYLVLENSKCRQYLSEKTFHHAYLKGAIPIIMGPSKEDCEKLLPPKSFLHVDSYSSNEDLAKDIISISRDKIRLQSFHEWRNDFEVVNEHGYFNTKSYHYCRLCEALNYNDDGVKIYTEDKIRFLLDPRTECS